MADEKKKSYGVSAFASSVHSQQKYIVFNLESVQYDIDSKAKGAARWLPHTASHELFHALGLNHPRTSANPGEQTDSRSWEQIKRDIAPDLSAYSTLGSVDPVTRRRTITYSFTADTALVPHGIRPSGSQAPDDPNAVIVEGIRHIGDNPDAGRNTAHQRIREAMKEAFAEHERLFNVKYVETKDPANANLLVYSAMMPARPQPSYELTRGSRNAYTHDVTIMSYNNADNRLYAMSGVGDIYVAQQTYGLPAPDATRNTITAEQLAHSSGVLWDNKPMAVTLAESPMQGLLTVNMDAHPYRPAITGTLKDKDGDRLVRQHIGKSASLRELDATGARIDLTVTGADNATIKAGSSSNTITVNGRCNEVILGPGKDVVRLGSGYGHVVTRLSEEDCIRAEENCKAVLQHWNTPDFEKGTLVTFAGDRPKSKGSVFIRKATPDEVMERLKEVAATIDTQDKPAITLDAVDKDREMETAPPVASFREIKDIIISSNKAAGHGIANLGGGSVIIKMPKPQYDSTYITTDEAGRYYCLSFRDGDETRKVNLPLTGKLALCGPDGQIQRVVAIADARKEHALAMALQKGTDAQLTHSGSPASLPFNVAALELQQR